MAFQKFPLRASIVVSAEGTGFEPVKGLRPRVFETRAIGRYANPPGFWSMRTRVGSNHQPQDPQSCTLSIELRVQTLSNSRSENGQGAYPLSYGCKNHILLNFAFQSNFI